MDEDDMLMGKDGRLRDGGLVSSPLNVKMCVLAMKAEKELRWPWGADLVIDADPPMVRVRTRTHPEGQGYAGIQTKMREGETVNNAALRCGEHIYRFGLSSREEFEPFEEIP